VCGKKEKFNGRGEFLLSVQKEKKCAGSSPHNDLRVKVGVDEEATAETNGGLKAPSNEEEGIGG